jgi:hypothetical protein
MLQSQATVLAGVASGQITPMQGAQVVSLIDVTRRLFETQELTERVRAMEQLLDKGCNKAA